MDLEKGRRRRTGSERERREIVVERKDWV